MTAARLTLLITSPRVPAGLLTRDAWQVLEAAPVVLASHDQDPVPQALSASGVPAETVDLDPAALAAELVARTAGGDVVWIGSPDGDPGLTDALAQELTRHAGPPEVEVLVGSWDAPGSRLLDAVAVMDQLRSPGGCPWDAQQTPLTLVPYLVEEAFEVVEAVESGDPHHRREELGDLLLQVLFQSRIAEEDEQEPFGIDEVAADLVVKLVGRHPNVFADGEASTPEEVERSWERIKAAEKPDRDSGDLLAGIPAGLPLPLTVEKVRTRLRRRSGDAQSDPEPDPELDAELAALAEHSRGRADEERERLRELLS